MNIEIGDPEVQRGGIRMKPKTKIVKWPAPDFDRLLSHDNLSLFFDQIERALAGGDLQAGAALLKDLIGAVRVHMGREDFLTGAVGVAPMRVRHARHEVILQRARQIQSRCESAHPTERNCRQIEDALVGLFSDLIEDELRVRHALATATTRGDSAPGAKSSNEN